MQIQLEPVVDVTGNYERDRKNLYTKLFSNGFHPISLNYRVLVDASIGEEDT